jgi:hypothetical protein
VSLDPLGFIVAMSTAMRSRATITQNTGFWKIIFGGELSLSVIGDSARLGSGERGIRGNKTDG